MRSLKTRLARLEYALTPDTRTAEFVRRLTRAKAEAQERRRRGVPQVSHVATAKALLASADATPLGRGWAVAILRAEEARAATAA
jgi:hypothetical protein